MAKQPPALSMSSLIANDAPLLSPVAMGDSWDHPDSFVYPYYMPLSPAASPDAASPVQPAKILKMRMSPDASQEQESLCLPTSQVFDLSDPAPAQAPVAVQEHPQPALDEESPAHPAVAAIASTASKRSASPAAGASSKKRATERVSSKDFVPPDVTGLSKREARLVKNRAAAFLSRQRKREEFETMEIRVAELEQENARLLALTQSGSSPQPTPDPALMSEVELLRAQLAAAEERERELAAKLVSTASSVQEVPVKLEAAESYVPPASPPSRSLSVPSANKTAASLGLMVLLCALPSLLSSVQMQTGAQTSFSVPTPFPSAAAKYDFSTIVPSDFDWTRSSLMNLDAEDMNRFSPAASASASKKLEFADVDMTELGDLNGLDISFDTSSTDNGKIRVRIHPSSSASSRAGSPGASSLSSKSDTAASSPMDMWSTDSELTFRSSFSSQGSPSIPSLSPSSSDPFLGDFSMPDMSYRMNDLDDGTLSEFGLSSEYHVPDSTGGKRRVRIALKNPPSSNTEGGEWEVEIC
ncbi:hypothetical protein MD484_g8997, partial [Candolleomyces efflorescens]